MIPALAFTAGVAIGVGVLAVLAGRRATRRSRDRLAIARHLAFIRAMSK